MLLPEALLLPTEALSHALQPGLRSCWRIIYFRRPAPGRAKIARPSVSDNDADGLHYEAQAVV